MKSISQSQFDPPDDLVNQAIKAVNDFLDEYPIRSKATKLLSSDGRIDWIVDGVIIVSLVPVWVDLKKDIHVTSQIEVNNDYRKAKQRRRELAERRAVINHWRHELVIAKESDCKS